MKRYTLDGTIDLVQIAVTRLWDYEEKALDMHPSGYYVAYSGGKDSDVIRILCALAGVKHELWHNHTTVDAPETVRYVRGIHGINISYPELSMWRMIVKRGMPPTRIARYCCAELKERGGIGRFVVTGVRKSESYQRSQREFLEVKGRTKKDKVVFTTDNHETKRTVYNCVPKNALILNPIIDWTDKDVWDFLHHHGCKSNPLYECGYKRVGCVGCPMATIKQRMRDLGRYPKYKANYIAAFDKMIRVEGRATTWRSGEEVYDWWMREPSKHGDIEGQISLLEE